MSRCLEDCPFEFFFLYFSPNNLEAMRYLFCFHSNSWWYRTGILTTGTHLRTNCASSDNKKAEQNEWWSGGVLYLMYHIQFLQFYLWFITELFTELALVLFSALLCANIRNLISSSSSISYLPKDENDALNVE